LHDLNKLLGDEVQVACLNSQKDQKLPARVYLSPLQRNVMRGLSGCLRIFRRE